ncbi:beta-1,6-N-acetylglucosaminyltransferase [Flavobacterium davisii]|uniref:beta-1,6-N-acetylglucosaminyltransferase n=1 Tax=Flavobacterium davisii TaxID=2906077 RepID=UPI000B4CA94A|nr:beta-1,6-N-acetylglucosaminyltransferase [Flavobacterium davisii]
MNNVYLITDRVDCIWGDFSTIIATLNLMENAINHHNEGFCILMSGHDYPIKNLSFIDAFFNQNKNTVFIDLDKAENIWPKFYERIKYYKINLSSKRGDFLLIKGLNTHTIKSLVKKEISFYQFLKIMVIKRKLTLPLKFYGGSQWWAMDLSILAKMNDYIKLNRHALFNFFVDSLLPDDFFFHSIIMYLKETGLPIEFDNSLTYINLE